MSAELRKIESAKKAEKEPKGIKTPSADRSEFSANAKRLSETKAQFQTIAASVAAQPDVRPERVAEVREKMEQGYYDSDEFIDKLADKLLAEFGIRPIET
ncbi:MAG: flagellar biosynthesis anti-sigma factor FlgM [Chitinispirillaceae bacterium]|nr:flagellar biosynthesis anti-sigma factor FlgM [Chitinispirillaceae bacterium]